MVFMMVLVTSLLYRANERMSVKSYFFQMSDFANQRVGTLQDINDISVNDLRNKLIKKYVSEYFKVIPGEQDVTHRPVLEILGPYAFEKWKKTEAKNIADMSAKKMFRMVRVRDDGIATVTKTKDVNYNTSELAQKIYYEVRYHMYTWNGSNILEIQPVYEQGTVYIEAKFKPGIKPNINVRKYLESGADPIGLFMFEVTNVGNKENL
jgi:hypothetical protein